MSETSEDEKPLASLQKLWKSKKDKFIFSCPTCQKLFRIKSKLVHHRYTHHGVGIKCKICYRTFSNISACVLHLSTKHSDQGYPCHICDFKSLKASEFKTHVQDQHENRLISKSKEENGDVCQLENHIETEKTLDIKNFVDRRKKFSCDICDEDFTLRNQLLRHKNDKHGVEIKCEICSQIFNSMVSLRSHKFTKHTGKDKICEICGYSTKKTYDFKRHQVKHSNDYTVMCMVCNKGFYSLYEFNEHKNVHTAERPYQCEVCGVDYSRRSSLILHRNRKHPEVYDSSKRCHICNQVCLTKETMEAHLKTHVEGRKRYYCDICGKGLLTRVILKIHRRSHTGEKPFDCSYCGRAFSCKKNLSVHIRLHTGDRPYSCKVCWKAYTKSSALKAHEKIHNTRHVFDDASTIEIKVELPLPEARLKQPTTLPSTETKKTKLSLQKRKKALGGDKIPILNTLEKVPCDVCGEFYKKNLLDRHKKRHLSRISHKCELCERSFTMMTKLVVHKKNYHGLEMSCEKCEKCFQNVYSFTAHLRNHKKEKTFICDVCGFATIEKMTLENHKLVKHQIGKFPLHCKICKKGFLSNYVLNDHINRHTGATPHQCYKCGSAYSSIKALERHNYKFHPELFSRKLLRCKSCSRVFKSKKKMEAHEADKHPNGQKNVCDFCGKDFSFRESLVRHRRIHTGEKPKECSICKRRFVCASYLQIHMRTHTGEKPYQCRFCWKKFSQRSSLVKHEKSHLKGLKSSGLEIISVEKESL